MSEHEDQTQVLRVMPHAQLPEKAVLSTLMHEPWRIEEAGLPAAMFYLPRNRHLLEDLTKVGAGWELESAVQRLHDNGMLDAVGGPAGITEVFTHNPGGWNFEKNVALLRDRMARRMLIAAAARASEAAFDCSDESDYLETIGEPFTAVLDAAAAIEPPRDTKALAREFIETFERRLRGEELSMGLPFGITEIDRNLRGIHPGHMGIISGRSGGGKSTLATQVAGNLAVEGVPVLFLPLERGDASIFERTVIQQAGVNHAVVKEPSSNKPSVEDVRSIRHSVTRVTDHLFVRKPPNRKLATIVAEIRRYRRLHGIQVAFVDHIALIRGERIKGDSGEAELRGISNTLQELGQELGICIVVLSQVTEEADTKGARAIEEDADWWLHIAQERDKKKENFGEHLHVLIAKDSHNGKAGERLPLVLNKENLRFVYGFPKSKEEAPKKSRYAH